MHARRAALTLLGLAGVAQAAPAPGLAARAEASLSGQLAFLVEHGDLVSNDALSDNPAHQDQGTDPQYDEFADGSAVPPEQLRFEDDGTFDTAADYSHQAHLAGNRSYHRYATLDSAFAIAADQKSAWAIGEYSKDTGCNDGPVGWKCPIDAWLHGAMLADLDGGRALPIVSHVAYTVDAKTQAAKGPLEPSELEAAIATGAEPVVALFTASIGDPAALGRSVSSRKDVELLGSALHEKYVGGGAVRARLAKWNLALHVRDGVRAGLTASKTVAWVAANVDARPARSPKAKPTPYRVLVIYERTGADWKLVQASFSVLVSPQDL